MKKKLALLGTCLFITSHIGFANNIAKNRLWQQSQKSIKAFQAGTETNPRLGYGYDNRTGLAMPFNCLANYNDPNAIEYSNPTGNIDFSTAISETELGEMLNISGSGDFGIEFFQLH